MKITHRALLVNTLITGSFLLGTASASAQQIAPQACNTPSGRCTASAPWCNSGYNGMLVPVGDTSGSCQTTNPNYTMRSTQRPLDCTGSLNSLPNGSCKEGYYCGTVGGARIGCVPNGQFNYGAARRNPTNTTAPNTFYPTNGCDPRNCNCGTILPPTIAQPTTASVFEALWNFVTHKRAR